MWRAELNCLAKFQTEQMERLSFTAVKAAESVEEQEFRVVFYEMCYM